MSNSLQVTLLTDNEKEDFYIVNSVLTPKTARQILVNNACSNLINSNESAGFPNPKAVVESFLARKGLIVSFDTPDSSNIQSISYNPVSETITFHFDSGGSSSYASSFELFLDAMNAPSAGKLQHAYRRGEI
jgi:hypothetical protein